MVRPLHEGGTTVNRLRRWSAGVAILLVVAAITMAGAPVTEARGKKPARAEGIDASHWQGTIDWTRVAGGGKKFVYLKATEGTAYSDPTFAGNRSGARAAGDRVGAYHFAQPDATAGDAVAEARWFLANTTFASNDLRPVLDIEVSGGLSVAALQQWVRAWLDEVYLQT